MYVSIRVRTCVHVTPPMSNNHPDTYHPFSPQIKNRVKGKEKSSTAEVLYESLLLTEEGLSIHGNLSTLGRPVSLPLIHSPPLHPWTNAIVYFLLLRLLHSLALTCTLLNWSETALIRGEECSVPLTEQQECRRNN